MIEFKSSSLLSRLSLTSDDSSRSSTRKAGRICYVVAALPINGQSASMFSANADLTYTN